MLSDEQPLFDITYSTKLETPRRVLREEIKQQVEHFLANGGVIQYIPPEVSAFDVFRKPMGRWLWPQEVAASE